MQPARIITIPNAALADAKAKAAVRNADHTCNKEAAVLEKNEVSGVVRRCSSLPSSVSRDKTSFTLKNVDPPFELEKLHALATFVNFVTL